MIFSDPTRRQFYSLLVDYFDNPVFEKLKNEDGYSIYICKIYSLLLNENRYLIAITEPDNYPIKKKIPLSDLKWISFQTRILSDNKDVIQHSYTIKKKYQSLHIQKSLQDNSMSIYQMTNNEFPIEITLLHTKNNEYEYPTNGNLVSCLETYQTIIVFSDK